MEKKEVKKRNWAFVVYPESLPAEWKNILRESGLQCAISPIHDKDLDPTGDVKKPHYHVIAVYGSPTTYRNVKSLTDRLNGPAPQALEQVRGYYRYLTHKDNPEKAQYNENEIETINGFNILDFVEMTKSEVLSYKRQLQTLIRDADILEYSDFMDLLQDSDMIQQYDVASNNTYFFEKYISSRRNKRQPKAK